MTVTQHEIDIRALGTIVSKTDLNGTILEVNQAFIEASGYTEAELIGQPHNILRHPDVPSAVFKDMWQTLQSGKPWVQVVKNRCKNGDHYWVQANVTPITNQGEIIAYQSVRTAVSQDTIESAMWLYNQVELGKVNIKNGYVMTGNKSFCLFNQFHPMNLMLFVIATLGSLATLISAGLVAIPYWAVGVISIVFLLYSWAGTKYVFSRLGKTKLLVERMREGDFSAQVDYYGHHGLSKLIASVKTMQIQLGAMYDEAQVKLHASLRMQASLENASSSVMVINPDGSIRYLNRALRDFLSLNLLSIQSVIPGFKVEHLVGSEFSKYFTDDVFSNLSDKRVFETTYCGLILSIAISPVKDEKDNSVGTIVEFTDLTQQRKIEESLKSTLHLASIGHTDLALSTEGLDGFLLDTSKNINALLLSINEIIEQMVYVMTNLAKGDVRGRVEKDLQGSLAAMKGATNVSLDNLSGIVIQIKQAASMVDTAAVESSKAALDLSSRTQQAAATLEEINATMKNINFAQEGNAQELIKIDSEAQGAVEQNGVAMQAIGSTVSAIEDIKHTSEKIANIIGMIDSIAFQTNLLALNAAVEAARAGEHGRGFAVVAGEVRSLAQKSAEAAKDIKVLIDESVNKVTLGVDKVQETSHAFEKVNSGVERIGTSISSVMQSIQEQQHSVIEVTQAIDDLDANIQNNAALVEETSAAADSLKDQAERLSKETEKFQVNEALATCLLQKSPDIHGVFMADVRRNMRIWRTTAQSYLNGVKVEMDLSAAVNPRLCGVGKAIGQILSAEPSVEQMPEFIKMHELHVRQHKIVEEVLLILEKDAELTISDMQVRDEKMDEFVTITEQLDEALAMFNDRYFAGYVVSESIEFDGAA